MKKYQVATTCSVAVTAMMLIKTQFQDTQPIKHCNIDMLLLVRHILFFLFQFLKSLFSLVKKKSPCVWPNKQPCIATIAQWNMHLCSVNFLFWARCFCLLWSCSWHLCVWKFPALFLWGLFHARCGCVTQALPESFPKHIPVTQLFVRQSRSLKSSFGLLTADYSIAQNVFRQHRGLVWRSLAVQAAHAFWKTQW